MKRETNTKLLIYSLEHLYSANLLKKYILKVIWKEDVASNTFYPSLQETISFTFIFIRLSWYSLLFNDWPINLFCMSKLLSTSRFFPSPGSHYFKFSSFKLDKTEGTVLTISKEKSLLNHKHMRKKASFLQGHLDKILPSNLKLYASCPSPDSYSGLF